eukprot:13583-Hanusia_phi.AAC.3
MIGGFLVKEGDEMIPVTTPDFSVTSRGTVSNYFYPYFSPRSTVMFGVVISVPPDPGGWGGSRGQTFDEKTVGTPSYRRGPSGWVRGRSGWDGWGGGPSERCNQTLPQANDGEWRREERTRNESSDVKTSDSETRQDKTRQD